MNRRHFLKLAGSGLVVATAAPIVEPVRRFWQVGRGAPVGLADPDYRAMEWNLMEVSAVPIQPIVTAEAIRDHVQSRMKHLRLTDQEIRACEAFRGLYRGQITYML